MKSKQGFAPMVRRNPRREMDRGSAQRTTKRPQEMWLSPHERARLPCQTGVRSSTVPLLRNAVATSCSARAIAARKPPPSPCPSPTSPPRPRPRRCNASPRPTARTRGREARTPPPPSIPPRPCAANLTPLASCPPRSPRRSQRSRARPAGSSLHVRATSPAKMTSDASARRDRASGAERVIGRELPSRVDEHLNVSLHTTGRAIDR